MPPAATLDFRSPATFSFDSPASSSTGTNTNTCSFNSGRPGSSARPKPRFFKHRRSSKAHPSTPVLDPSINPFRSVDSGFAFGVSNSNVANNNNLNSNCNNSDSNEINVAGKCGDHHVGFVFGVSSLNDGNDNGAACNVGLENVAANGVRVGDGGGVGGEKNVALEKEGFRFSDHVGKTPVDETRREKEEFRFSDNVGDNVSFVFGVSNSGNVDGDRVAGSNAANGVGSGGGVGLGKEEFKFGDHVGRTRVGEMGRGEDGAGGVTFKFGANVKNVGSGETGRSGLEAELSNGMKKLNIEHNEKGGGSVEHNEKGGASVEGRDLSGTGVSRGGDPLFVFTSGGGSSDVSGGGSVSGMNLDGGKEGVCAGKSSGLGFESDEEKVFVFGNSGNSGKSGASSSQSFAFTAEVGEEREERDFLSSSFSFSSSGDKLDRGKSEECSVSEDRNAEFSSPSFCTSAEFKLPDFGSSLSFSANLPCGLDKKLESGQRTRVSRDKKLKKAKGKSRQSRQPLQTPESSQNVVQEEEAPGYYSPMDFSPYEDTTSKDDVPLSGHQASDQTEMKNGNLSAMYTESQPNPVFMSSGSGGAPTCSAAGISSKTSGYDNGGTQDGFSSNVASTVGDKFAFTASNSAQDQVSSGKHQREKKKYRLKPVNLSAIRGSSLGRAPLHNRLQGKGANFSVPDSNGKAQKEDNKEQSCESAWSAAEKACDKWRRRGNEAYEKGELSKAEDFYTWGLNCVPTGDESVVASGPLVRCYSNRGATRMALGRVREAIQDCLMAVKLDPTFHRAQMRAANCHLLLGELDDAMQCFAKLMESANVICLDRQVVISASDGIQKSQKVSDCINRSAELLKMRTSEAAANALESIAEAMSISLYSEKLLEMKAEALCLLQKHEEAITLCQHTLDFAEKNFIRTTSGNHEGRGSCLDVRLWRHHISSRCYYHLGRLEVALDLLEKQECTNKTQDSPDPLAAIIHELLKQKSAGNTAFQSGKHAEAIEHYTSAICSSMESRPFAAICFCNRAAAHQALGQITDAIADCSLAIALDEKYAKAVSRRATLHEMIRDYKQAAVDLQRLVSLLEKQSHEKSKQSGSGNGKELRQVRLRLSAVEEEAKRDVPLDLYLILGTKKADPASEIKKAYRKAALRHHPDKAGQALVRNDGGDEGRHWKDIAELVHKDSDRLFKMIGEAYAVLSDPTKREDYDHEEDMRKALKECSNLRSTSRRHSEYYSQGFPFERSSNRRYWQDDYKTYNYSHRRW